MRQAEIEDDGVVALGLPEKVRALAVGRAVHRVAGLAERRRQLLRQPRFVFDDQDPHPFPSFRRTMNFRVTVRDGQGGIDSDDVLVNVVNTAAFSVQSPTARAAPSGMGLRANP